MNSRTTSVLATLTLLAVVITSPAQKPEKKWTDWSKQEAEKILESSPWAQTQTETDTSEMFFSPTSDPGLGARTTSTTDSRLGQGATNQSVNVRFHARFLSARPIRQAFARLMTIKSAQQMPENLRAFAETRWENSIIVAVTVDATDQRQLGPVMQAFNSATTGTLKNKSYLERNDGKRIFLEEYDAPSKDGFGARFIFLRYPDEKPFIDADTKEIRFYAEFSSGVKIDRRFKVADMMYQGELEY